MFTPLRFVLRVLQRSPAFTTIAVLVLGVGIGVNTVVFSALDALLFRPLPYGNGDRLVLLGERDKASGLRAGTSMAAWREWRDNLHSFEDLAAIDPELTVAVGDAGTYVSAARVSTNFFALLQVTPTRGRGFLIDDGAVSSAPVVLVSEEFWRRALGAPQSLAEQWLAINHRPHAVVGVLPAGFKFTYARFDVWLPLPSSAPHTSVADRNIRIVARLRPGVSLHAARADVQTAGALLERAHPDTHRGRGLWLQSMRDAAIAGREPIAAILSATAALGLLVACFNIGIVQMVRTTARQRELAVRLAMGAGTWRIAGVAVTEGLAVAGAGGALGFVLAWAVTRLAVASVPELRDLVIDGRVLAFSTALSCLSAVICSVGSAVMASRLDMIVALKAGSAWTSTSRARLQHVFIVAQTACAVTLVVAAAVLVSALQRLTSMDPGFRTDGILVAELSLPSSLLDTPGRRLRVLDDLTTRLESLPGVTMIAAASSMPFFGVAPQPFALEGRAPPIERLAGTRAVTPSYFALYDIPIVAGRGFVAADGPEGDPVAVVSRRLADQSWPRGEAVGARLRLGAQSVTVVGVAADVRSVGLRQPVLPEIYRPFSQAPPAALSVALRMRGEPLTQVSSLRAAVHALGSEATVSYANSMQVLLAEQLTLVRWLTVLSTTFATLALALAAVGLYGVVAFLAARRTREIGIRLALGADRRGILRLVLAPGAVLVLGGSALGTVASIGVVKVLAAVLLEAAIPPLWVAAVVVLVIGAADLLAMGLPAWRAAHMNPLVALRQD